MWYSCDTHNKLVKMLTENFRSFGGGEDVKTSYNPIAHALKDEPAQFAAGVDISDVVRAIMNHLEPMDTSVSDEPLTKGTTGVRFIGEKS